MNDILVEDGIALYLMLLPRRKMLALCCGALERLRSELPMLSICCWRPGRDLWRVSRSGPVLAHRLHDS